MKKRTALLSLFACIISVTAFLLSGCYIDTVKNMETEWQLDFTEQSDYEGGNAAKLAFRYFTVVLDLFNGTMDIDYALNDCVSDTDIYKGTLPVRFSFWDEHFAASYEYGDYRLSLSGNGTRAFLDGYGELHVKFDRDIEGYKANEYYTLYLDFIPLNGQTPQDPDEPDEPDGPTESRFGAVKTAYEDAGYTTELTETDVDASTAALIESLKSSYAALGMEMCFIGKNLDDPASAEIYMLISSDNQSDIKQISDALGGVYKLAVKDNCAIIYISFVGTPDFTPFEKTA